MTFGDALYHCTEDVRNGCHGRLDVVRNELSVQVNKTMDSAFDKIEGLCREQLDHIVSTMEPAVGDARSLQKEVETLRAQLSEVTFNRDFLMAENQNKDKEIELLKRKVFRLESRSGASSTTPTNSGVPQTTETSSAVAPTAVPMEDDQAQGAEGGTPTVPVESPAGTTGSEGALTLIRELMANAGPDQLRMILGGVCQALAPAVMKAPPPP